MKSVNRLRSGIIIAIIDTTIIVISLLFSWLIRSQFEFFIFKISQFIIVLPYVILIRLFTNLIFEKYSLSFYNIHISDIVSIFLHNLIPSAMFILIRIFSPIKDIRIPLSIIFSEYVITSAGMILIRILILNYIVSRSEQGKTRKRFKVILVGNIGNISFKKKIRNIRKNIDIEIMGLLSDKTLEWNTDYEGIRILGGYSLLNKLALSNSDLSTIIIDESTNYIDRMNIIKKCKELSLHIFTMKNGKILPFKSETIFNRNFKNLIPEVIDPILVNKKIYLNGIESVLMPHIELVCPQKHKQVKKKSTFDSFLDIDDLKSSDIVIDLILLVAFEKNIATRQYYSSYVSYLTNISKTIIKQSNILYTVVAPANIIDNCRSIFDISNINLLITEGIICNCVYSYEYYNGLEFMDYPEHIASSIFKMIYCEKKDNRIFYSKSNDAIHIREYFEIIEAVRNPLQLIENKSIYTEENTKIKKLFRVLPTSFSNLYILEKQERKNTYNIG